MTAGKKAGTTRVTKGNTRLTLDLLETARHMHAGGLLTDVVRDKITIVTSAVPPLLQIRLN